MRCQPSPVPIVRVARSGISASPRGRVAGGRRRARLGHGRVLAVPERLRVARAVLGVGEVGGDEEELAVDDRDFVRSAGGPFEHLAEGELAALGGLAALCRGHRPHPRQPVRVDRQAGRAGDRGPRLGLLCRFPHCFGSSVGEHGRGSGAGADGCQAEKLDSRRTARADHPPGPKAGLPAGAGGALFCLICRQAKPRSRRICSPTEGTKAHRARRRRAVDPPLSRSRSGGLSWLAVMIRGCSWSCPASRCAASRGSSGARARSRTRAPTWSRSSP